MKFKKMHQSATIFSSFVYPQLLRRSKPTLSKVQILIDDFDNKVNYMVELINQSFTNQSHFIDEKFDISNSSLAKLIYENGLNKQTEEFIATLTFLEAAKYKNLPLVKDFLIE
ncbi:hypothetical protein AB3503_00595 [Acinetobacter baumannii]